MHMAQQLANGTDTVFPHPFDDPDVICGQGTIGLELKAHCPEVVFVPIGGGGLASGLGLALRTPKPRWWAFRSKGQMS